MSHFWLINSILILAAYLLGSISSAILICKFMRLKDPRNQGSGNPGATNVLRIGGKVAAFLTLVGDILKGFLPVFIVKSLNLPTLTLSLVMLAAFIGHLYPIFFKFKGGKGVATAFGSLSAISFPIGIALMATWLCIAVIFRYSSLAALITAILAPFYVFYFINSKYATLITISISCLLIYRHKNNIQKLISQQERKIGH